MSSEIEEQHGDGRNWSKRERVWTIAPSTGKGYWRYKGIRETVVDSRDTDPYQHSTTDPNYLLYHERKMKIRSEYPLWNGMNRKQWQELYIRIFELCHTDPDYKYYWEVTNERFVDMRDRGLLERKMERSKKKPNGWTGEGY